MKIGRDLFINSTLFGLVVGAIYWFSSRHPGGALLLVLMGVAASFVALFMFVAERHADLAADRRDGTYAQVAGEPLGIFTTQSIWPFALAVAVFAIVLGAVWSPIVAAAAAIALILILWRMVAESNRV